MIFTLKRPPLTGGTIKAMFLYVDIFTDMYFLDYIKSKKPFECVNEGQPSQTLSILHIHVENCQPSLIVSTKNEFRVQYIFFSIYIFSFSSIKHFSETIKWLNSNYATWTFINSILKPLVTSLKQELSSSNAVTQCQKWESRGTTASLAIASY